MDVVKKKKRAVDRTVHTDEACVWRIYTSNHLYGWISPLQMWFNRKLPAVAPNKPKKRKSILDRRNNWVSDFDPNRFGNYIFWSIVCLLDEKHWTTTHFDCKECVCVWSLLLSYVASNETSIWNVWFLIDNIDMVSENTRIGIDYSQVCL